MPASTALNGTKCACVISAMTRASVVLPVPGGPQRMIDCSRSRSIASRSGLPGAEDLLLADELVERARPHPLGERGAGGRPRGLPAPALRNRVVVEEGPAHVGSTFADCNMPTRDPKKEA